MEKDAVITPNLETYGFSESGKCEGNIESYKSFLDKFRTGYITKEGDLRKKTEEEKVKIQKKIDEINIRNQDFEGQIKQLNGQIEDKELEITRVEKEMQDIQTKSADSKKYTVFSWSTFLTYVFFLIPLSVYLVFFYTAIGKSALYGLNPESIISGKTISLPILPDFEDLMDALQTNYMLILFPFLFFAFGIVLHIFFEKKTIWKYLWIIAVILITLLADGFLAYKIHEQATIALEYIMDKEDIPKFITAQWFKDVNFYLVLVLGFIAFIMWSIIFHSTKTEWTKRNVIKFRNKLLESLRHKIDEIKIKIRDLNTKIGNNNVVAEHLNRDKETQTISAQTLENNINEFTIGWNHYLAGLYGSQAKNHIALINTEKSSFLKRYTTNAEPIFYTTNNDNN